MRFIGFRWTPGARDEARAARAFAERLGESWETLVDWRGLLLLRRYGAPCETLPHGMGVVFGECFGREPDASPPCEHVVDPAPGWIAERWGAYVAVLIDRGYDIIRVLRDPSGAMPCYLATLEGVRIFFGDARDYVAIAPAASADLGFLRAFLRYPLYLGRRTGLAHVEELWPAECAIFPRAGRELEIYWSPRTHRRKQASLDWNTGKAELRSAAQAAVRSYATRYPRAALRLSGGFDSSVMLGLLREADADVVCVNEYWEGAPEGDERLHARETAGAAGVALHELRIDPHQVRYDRVLAAPLTAKPTLALLSYGSPDIEAFYASLGCSFIASGQGGDHLFHRSRTAWIAADAMRDGVLGQTTLKIALETAHLTGKPIWTVLAAMALGAVHWRPRFGCRSEVMGVLSAYDATDEAGQGHAWITEGRGEPPARALRARQLLDALSYHDDSILSAAAPTRPLFLSQPVIEVCLRIPPYVMTRGGQERSLARAAFEDLAPPSVMRRVSKGETTRFFSAVLAANVEWIHSVLSDGLLVETGLANKDAMNAALAGDWRQDGLATDGLYALIAAECWLRNLQREIAAAASARQQSAPPSIVEEDGVPITDDAGPRN